jgi:hypothetical protein
MQLGPEIGKMTRKLFTGFSKSRPWMLNTADRMAAHRKLDRRRDDLCAVEVRKRVVRLVIMPVAVGCIAWLGGCVMGKITE